MRLENSFEVPGPPAEAWKLLNDVPRVIPCMPGAELVEVVDESTWKATMHVKLGPIALQFATDVTRKEADEAAGRAVLAAKAREVKGRGGAQATIESSLAPAGTGTTVTIVTDLQLQGAVAQYGRGVVAGVAAELTKRFAACLAKQLAAPADEPPAPGGGADAPFEAPVVRAPAAPVKPVGGLGLAFGALWARVAGLFRRG